MQATIKTIDQTDNSVSLTVDYDDGKQVQTKTYTYTSGNLNSKQEVLDMIDKELQLVSGFTAIVEDLKTEIDVPISVKAVEAVAEVL